MGTYDVSGISAITIWGSHHVTNLHAYNPVVLENAVIYSDNIYFAKAALKIGAEEMKDSLLRLGFCRELPFQRGYLRYGTGMVCHFYGGKNRGASDFD